MLRFRRISLLATAVAAAGACEIFNAPADVIPGPGGAGGGMTTSSTSLSTSSTTSSTSSSSTGTGGGHACAGDADCTATPPACSAYSCQGGTCVLGALPDATLCDDGLYCTVGDACKAGVCTGLARFCPAKDECNLGVCDEPTLSCTFAVGNEGGSCDDGNPCDNPGTCHSGTCEQGTEKCSSLATDCLTASCSPGVGCVTQNKSDGTTCGVTSCSNGICSGGHCAITAVNQGRSCNDGLFCTINDTCQNGYCIGQPFPCSSVTACVLSACDEAAKGCVATPIPDGSPCNDGNACHGGATCSDQVCLGGTTPTAVFVETFDDNSQGWTLGTEWQIGRATVSHGQNAGFPDPGTDHTGNTANGVAGVDIGGNEVVASPDPTHGFYYLTSPPVDTTPLAGSVFLTYWRWLNSDTAPYMVNRVEASADGATWTVLWQSGGNPPITDSAWTFESLDVTAYKSVTSQYRFGFDIGDQGVFLVSSWNLDDVKLQNAPCPN